MWLFKQKEPLVIRQTAQIARQHISFYPTKLSIILLLLSVAIWIGAVNYQVNVEYALCFWVIGFIGVAALLTYRQLMGLHVEIHCQEEVFAGQNAPIQLQFRHHSAYTRLLWWRGYHGEMDEEPYAISAWARQFLSKSQPTQTDLWALPINERGYFPESLYITIATSAPFGLFYAECSLHWQSDNLAFAAPLAHQEWGNHAHTDPNERAQHAAMNGEDIAYLNTHQAGSSLQHIAWKTYAKRGELMDKVFDQPPMVQHNETISFKDYPAGISKDKLASLMTYRVLQAERNHQIYTLELPRTTFAPQNGMREKCLTALALM